MRLLKFLFLGYLVIFPFGLLLSLSPSLFGQTVRVHPADLLVFSTALLFVLKKTRLPKIFKDIKNYLFVLSFSWLFSLSVFTLPEAWIGLLYLLRVMAYAIFFLAVYKLSKKEFDKDFLLKSLLGVSSFIGIFGLFQYFSYPDVRALAAWNWDDHLLRLIGTFLDPGFTVIFLVFGFLIALGLLVTSKHKIWLFPLALMLVTIALTYSRAGYLALLAGSLAFLSLNKKMGWAIVILLLLVGTITVIPGQGSEGVLLTRTTSIYDRLASYSQGVSLFGKFPIFGIGYNNLCIAKAKFTGDFLDYSSHACSGLDSGPLMVLATSGIVGLIALVYFSARIFKNLGKTIYAKVFLASSVSLLVHSLFTNSLFYPWVMGYMGILLALSVKERS